MNSLSHDNALGARDAPLKCRGAYESYDFLGLWGLARHKRIKHPFWDAKKIEPGNLIDARKTQGHHSTQARSAQCCVAQARGEEEAGGGCW